ncbi:MAG: DUF6765 family protein [Faecalibacterium sp.]
MQIDFHYYATYCAAVLAGYSHAESLEICTAAQYVDCCTKTALKKMKAPLSAATTQTQMEIMESDPGILCLQDITRIWASFHFLPGDLTAKKPHCSRRYLNKYRLICQPNSSLLLETLQQARKIGTLQAVGIAMHVLADTWAHRNFAGTPSMVINNISSDFYELRTIDGETVEKKINFRHKVGGEDDLENGCYTNTVPQFSENNVMNLGHGRAGHLPDYSFVRYRYLPAWAEYEMVLKDNPLEYLHAFAQMVYAMKWLRGEVLELAKDTYDWEGIAEFRGTIEGILNKRQLLASQDWKALGEKLSGQSIPAFTDLWYEREYLEAGKQEKDDTAPGRFIYAALAQKSMVTKRIFDSGSLLAGFSVDYLTRGFRGIKDFRKLIE